MLVLVSGLVFGLVSAAVGLAASLSVTSKQLAVYRTCVISAAANSSNAVSDSWADQRNPTTNNNAATLLNVASESTRNARTYVKFDLTKCTPAIPATATVRSATLRLYLWTIPGSCRTHDLFTVTGTWSETTVTWTAFGGAAGQPTPATTAANTPASGTRKSSITVGTCGNTAQGYVSGWDVTSDVQAYAAGTATNNGWMIRDDVENASFAVTAAYLSKANGNGIAGSPQLFVTYST
jgi:hypothetical protein